MNVFPNPSQKHRSNRKFRGITPGLQFRSLLQFNKPGCRAITEPLPKVFDEIDFGSLRPYFSNIIIYGVDSKVEVI